MASDLLVILGATQVHGTMPLYLRQLEAAGIEYAVESCSDKPNINGGGNLGYRVKKFREWANRFSNYERLVISDAFDVTFYGSKEDVLAKIPMDRLIHAGEKNCYPADSQSLPVPDRGPWRYANGGLVAGTPEHFHHWCTYTERHPLYNPDCLDQYFLNLQISEGVGCLPDYKTELFFCLYGGYEELEFERGLPVNRLYGTKPNFLHANGKWTADEMFAKYERSLK
jgi:hypothetical protein